MPRPFSLQQSRLCPVIYGMNSIRIHLLDPHWNMPRRCDLYTTTQTVSLIISKTNRTVKRHSITCKQLCHVHSACSGPSSWLSGTPATRRRHFIQITWGGGGVGYIGVAIQSLTKRPVNFFHIATFQSATFGRPLFAFVLCVLRQKIIKKPKMLGKRIDRRNR